MSIVVMIMGSYLFHIPVQIFCMEVLKMGEVASAIIGGAAGIIAAIITGVISIAVQNRKLKEIIRHLGFGEDEASMKRQLEAKIGTNPKSIDEQLGVNNKSLSEQLGVGVDDCSLTKQHEELKRCITEKNTDITSIAAAVRNIEERRNNLNNTQQSLLDTLNAFMINWQELQTKANHLEVENAQYKEYIMILESENAQLRANSEMVYTEDDELEL